MPVNSKPRSPARQLSPRRAARLYRLLKMLAARPCSRTQLIRLGRAGMRTLYRDLAYLLACRVDVRVSDGQYELVSPMNDALKRLPFPTVHLTFADVAALAKGKGSAHRKLKAQLIELT